jgi:transposase
VSEGALVGCKFTENWTAEAIEPELSAITGFTQVDDYKGYLAKRKFESEDQGRPLVLPERRLGCMMHVRRRFVRALKAGDPLALTPCQYIKDIYKVEREAKELGLSPHQRHRLRQEKSKPMVDALYAWIDAKEGILRPKSPLSLANHYAKQQQLYIENCFTDGRFEIDNGRTEREIRGIAVGRKNFLFSGSAEAASRMAGAFALVSSCRQLGLPVREYLADVIEQVASGSVKLRKLHRLCPDIWGIRRGLLPPGNYLEQKVAKKTGGL